MCWLFTCAVVVVQLLAISNQSPAVLSFTNTNFAAAPGTFSMANTNNNRKNALVSSRSSSFAFYSGHHRYRRRGSNMFSTVDGEENEEEAPQHKVSIEYCTGCRWMLRAAWFAQELLTTFQDDLHSVSLVPSRPPSPGGTFVVMLNDNKIIWNRKEEGRFPEAKELKQRIRDGIKPGMDLGHSDVPHHESAVTAATPSSSSNEGEEDKCVDCDDKEEVEEMDEDQAAELRKQFGVL